MTPVRILTALAATFALTAIQIASADRQSTGGNVTQAVQEILTAKSGDIDFAHAKLAIDKLIDPTIDINASLHEIERLVGEVSKIAGPTANGADKISAVRKVIYEPGPWNGNRPFSYDMSDPEGTKLANKLLPNYLRTRTGNCVSMPILFLILADRVGLNVTLSTAPRHVFIKYTDQAGKTWNIETTSGGNPARDAWIREKLGPFGDDAIANGVYMKTLSRRESLAVIADIMLQSLGQREQWNETIDITGIIVKAFPQHVSALLARGNAYGRILEHDCTQAVTSISEIASDPFTYCDLLADQNELAFVEAEMLGWRETDGARSLR